jgi:hypothetical protein
MLGKEIKPQKKWHVHDKKARKVLGINKYHRVEINTWGKLVGSANHLHEEIQNAIQTRRHIDNEGR